MFSGIKIISLDADGDEEVTLEEIESLDGSSKTTIPRFAQE